MNSFFNEKLSNLRRTLHREATDVMQKQVLKGTRVRHPQCCKTVADP